jgi:propionyl-CoA carboxylase beta chain
MGAEGAVEIIFKREIRDAENPAQKRDELIHAYNELMMNPYIAAKCGYVSEVILPSETRDRILQALDALKGKRADGRIWRKHGNIPL